MNREESIFLMKAVAFTGGLGFGAWLAVKIVGDIILSYQ